MVNTKPKVETTPLALGKSMQPIYSWTLRTTLKCYTLGSAWGFYFLFLGVGLQWAARGPFRSPVPLTRYLYPLHMVLVPHQHPVREKSHRRLPLL
jgi:hypothetical protein